MSSGRGAPLVPRWMTTTWPNSPCGPEPAHGLDAIGELAGDPGVDHAAAELALQLGAAPSITESPMAVATSWW